MESPDTFTLLPLEMDPQTSTITASQSTSNALQTELDALNNLHRNLLHVETPTGTAAYQGVTSSHRHWLYVGAILSFQYFSLISSPVDRNGVVASSKNLVVSVLMSLYSTSVHESG